jgi:ferredoxin
MEIDTIIFSEGRRPDWSCLGRETACRISGQNTIHIAPVTMQTDDPAIFAGGDAAAGPGTVIEAVESGKQAAISIDRYLKGEDLGRDRPEAGQYEIAPDIPTSGYDPVPRQLIPNAEPENAPGGFQELQPGFTDEQAVSEANRCINCGVCAECYQCVNACPAKAVTLQTHCLKPGEIELSVGAVVMAPGIELFNPSSFDAYGYNKFADVITSMEFERILSASGPYSGHMVRPSDQKEPEKIAWIQCVGSRDEQHGNLCMLHVCDQGSHDRQRTQRSAAGCRHFLY